MIISLFSRGYSIDSWLLLNQVNEEASDRVLEVEQKYNEIRYPIYEKINSTIQAIPDFWLTAVCNLCIYLPWAISLPCQLRVLVSNPYITETLISIFLGTLEMAICKTWANKFGLGMIWVLISLTLVS